MGLFGRLFGSGTKGDKRFYYQRGMKNARMGDLDSAIEDFKKVPSHSGPVQADIDAYYNLGLAHEKQEKYHEAIEFYTKAIELKPDFANAYCNRGAVYNKLNDFESAIEDSNKTIELNPNDALAYWNRGIAYDNTANRPRAIKDVETFLRMSPSKTAHRDYAGQFLRKLKDALPEEDEKRREVDALIQKGSDCIDQKHYEKAIEWFDKALEIDPLRIKAWDEKTNALWFGGNSGEALECCKQAVTMLDEEFVEQFDARILFTHASLLAEHGKKKEAIESFEKYIQFAAPEFARNIESAKKAIKMLKGGS